MNGQEPTKAVEVERRNGDEASVVADDLLIVEEPLAIEVEYGMAGHRERQLLSVTMRTPGHDLELAVGLARAEGVIREFSDLHQVREILDQSGGDPHGISGVRLSLREGLEYDPYRMRRALVSASSCGFCGRLDLEFFDQLGGVRQTQNQSAEPLEIREDLVWRICDQVRENQVLFRHTGAVHGAGIFDRDGSIHLVREDIGRHNAMDKIVGAMLTEGRLPASSFGICYTGRTSFELVQKALAGGFTMIISVGAPSSMAVRLCQEYGICLVGFVKGGNYNIYSHPERILRK